jgi:6-phosphogluconolactonase (cycloisomerase 2 family)
MKVGMVVRGILAATPLLLLAGCGDFWQSPNSGTITSFALTNSANITVSPGATSNNTSTITVTPASTFTGTVTLTCSITSEPASPTSAPTCSLSPASLDFTTATAQPSTLTATTTSTTTPGAYQITVTGVSGNVAETTTACLLVGSSATSCTSTTAGTSGNFYIMNPTSVSGDSIISGALTPISGSTVTLTGATAMAISPDGSVLYIAENQIGIVSYAISSSGALTLIGSVAEDPDAEALAVDPSGNWLLDASASGALYAYPVAAGVLNGTEQSQPLASILIQPGQLAISPNGAFVAVALGSTGTQLFSFSSETLGAGSTPIAPYGGSSGAAVAVAFDPQSRFMYIGETAAFSSATNSGALRVYTVGANSVTQFTYATPYAPLGTGPHAILPDASGTYVYVASWQTGTTGVITGYSVSTTALTAIGTTVATGTEPDGLAEDNTGSFVLAISASGPTFDSYTFDTTTLGQLDSSLTSTTTPSTPIAIVAAPVQ